MLANTVIALISDHGMGNLVAIHSDSREIFLASAHTITILPALGAFSIIKTPTASNNLRYVDFRSVSHLEFAPGTSPINDSAGDIEGRNNNEVKRFILVQSADIGANYTQQSLGQIKETRAYATAAQIGDPCTVVTFHYATNNPNMIPNKTIKSTTVVTADDLS